MQLVLIGGDDYFYKKLKKNAGPDVIFPGFVKDSDLDILVTVDLSTVESLKSGVKYQLTNTCL